MKLLLTLIAFLGPLMVAAADDQAVSAMAKATGFTEQEIREHGETGCDSGVQLHMTICALYHYYEKDVALNAAYQALMRRLQQPSAREELRKAQRAWLAYRDAQCRFDTSAWQGGTLRPMLNANCLGAMTEARTHQLKKTLACKEAGCPQFKDE